jgi:hypothetical protein
MLAKYAAIHAEAEVYFERLISGRRLSDEELIRLVGTRQNAAALFKTRPGELYQRSDWDRFIDQSGTPEMRALVGPDREFLVEHLYYLYVMTEAANAELTRERYEERREHLTRLTGSETVPLGSGLTLMDAYEQAWVFGRCLSLTRSAIDGEFAFLTDLGVHIGLHSGVPPTTDRAAPLPQRAHPASSRSPHLEMAAYFDA